VDISAVPCLVKTKRRGDEDARAAGCPETTEAALRSGSDEGPRIALKLP
jgi:hypothetical protein